MNLTEKGGVALHFFASDRSRRNYIDALPDRRLQGLLQIRTIVRGKSTACAGEGGWHTNKRVTTPRSMGGLGHWRKANRNTINSSPEKRRERPRPVAWPQDPPGQYQPPLCLA